MWICTLQSLLLHIIKYSEFENKALKTLPNIYFYCLFWPHSERKTKRKNKTFFFLPTMSTERESKWIVKHWHVTIRTVKRDRHIYREVEWRIQLLPWQHVILPIMMSLKFIFGVLWEGHIFKCILMYSCRSIFYQTELLRTRVHYSKHSGFKHSFYRLNDFQDLMNHLCRIPSFSRDVSSYITNSLWKYSVCVEVKFNKNDI